MGVINRDGRFVARFRDEHGKKREHSFGYGEDARIAAEKYCQQWENYHEQMCQYQYEQELAADPNTITLKKLVEEYIQQAQLNGRSENHIMSLRYVAEAVYYKYLGADTPITLIDYGRDILPFLSKLKTEPRKNGKMLSIVTVNRYGNFLKSFFNYAIRRGYIDRNPMVIWVKAFEPRKERLLDREMIEKIMAHAPQHLAWAIEVAYNTGARTGYSELLSLKWSDVDYEKGLVHIYASKTKTDRWVPVSDEFLERLRLHQAQSKSEYIVSYAGKQVKNIHKSFRTACLRAGITEPVRFYDVRHRFASELFNSNVPLGVVSRTIGHTRVSTTTDVYLEVLPKEIFDIRGKLPALKLPSSKHRQKGLDDKGRTGTD